MVQTRKHGKTGNGKQRCRCGAARRSFRENREVSVYTETAKDQILRAYQERSSLRGLTRIFGVSRNTVSKWLKKSPEPAAPVSYTHLDVYKRQCHYCGCYRESLPLSVREWTCTECGTAHDRDVNAALNLQRAALASGSCPDSKACGEAGSGRSRKTPVKPASMKQEINHVSIGYG